MRLRLKVTAVHGLVTLIALASPVGLAAQGETYFQVLALPPASVGTCVAPTPARTARHFVVERAHLIMTAVRPTRRREIIVSADSLGRTVGLSEFEMVSTGMLSMTGDQVIADIDAAGRVRGVHDRTITEMSDSGIVRFDTAALRRMSERAVHRSTHDQLDGTAQLKAIKLADWMRRRCRT